MNHKKGSSFLAASLAFLVASAVAGPVLASGGSGTNFWVPTSASTTQVEPLGYAGASGFQDVRARNITAGTGAASTSATDGFVYTQGGAGTPTGVPAVTHTGSYPLYVDATNNLVYAYNSGWHSLGASSLQGAYTAGGSGGGAITLSATGSSIQITNPAATNQNAFKAIQNTANQNTAYFSGQENSQAGAVWQVAVMGLESAATGHGAGILLGTDAAATFYANIKGVAENGATAPGAFTISTQNGSNVTSEHLRVTSNGGINAGGIATVTTEGQFLTTSTGEYLFANGTGSTATADTGLSRSAAATVAVGNGTQGDTTGNLQLNKITKYNGTTTVALGVPAIVATSRVSAATTNQTGLLNFTVGASDSTFVVSANLLVTAYTSGTINVQVVFTDESNTVRTFTMPLMQGSGSTFSGSNAVACFAAVPHHLRCKAGTTISVQSAGTWVATFNLEAYLEQIG